MIVPVWYLCFSSAGLFRMSVTVEGQTYEGMGNTKKSAKVAAATAGIIERFKVSCVIF